MTQRVATPVGSPQTASIDQCECGKRIIRLHMTLGQWRHDNGNVTCDPFVEPSFAELVGRGLA